MAQLGLREVLTLTFGLVLLLLRGCSIEAVSSHRSRFANTTPWASSLRWRWLSARPSWDGAVQQAASNPCRERAPEIYNGADSCKMAAAVVLRGGSSMQQSIAKEENEDEAEQEQEGISDRRGLCKEEGDRDKQLAEGGPGLYDGRAVEWMMQQLCMYQMRMALISKPLAAKGYKLREIVPSPRGLVCALSTEERRMDCRMYVEAEVGKKVVAPCKCKGTQKWISLSALNSERRREAAKWKHCPVCQAPIDYKLYEVHGGSLGKVISAVLNNAGVTRAVLGALTTIVFLIASPMLHAAVVRVLTSGILWQNYHRVNIIINMPLPLQIMAIRFLMKWAYGRLLALESILRQSLTDLESEILEGRLPITVEVNEDGEEVPVTHRRP